MNKNVKKNIKKEKTAAAFTNFFLPKNKEIPKDEPDSFDRLDCTTFIVKEENMRLATVLKMETDDSASASSRQLVTQKAGEDEYDDVFAVDDSMNLSIDVDLYQNDGRFSKTESSAPVTAAFKLNAEKKPSKLKALLHSYRDEILENRSRQRRLLKKNTASRPDFDFQPESFVFH
ncbi:uncharacterized protein LOC135845817 isoform X2 [Planococcus citri]|uniref:uncharacterized protein LOC135845817 isoform X2 n=1 Tax=Planococcus citri TaxID=170843 RepID=UPI0031F72370